MSSNPHCIVSLSIGKCRQRTVQGNCCVFPFAYRGRRYRSCTSRGSRRPWCPVLPGYKRGQPWGYCRGKRCKKTSFNILLSVGLQVKRTVPFSFSLRFRCAVSSRNANIFASKFLKIKVPVHIVQATKSRFVTFLLS